MQGKMHDRVVEMRLCFFSGKVGDYKVPFKSTRKCRSTATGRCLCKPNPLIMGLCLIKR